MGSPGFLVGAAADGLKDGGGATAATEVAVHAFEEFGVGGFWVFLEEADGGHDHPSGAVAALEGAFVEEGPLKRVGLVAGGEAFGGVDGFCLGCGRRRP